MQPEMAAFYRLIVPTAMLLPKFLNYVYQKDIVLSNIGVIAVEKIDGKMKICKGQMCVFFTEFNLYSIKKSKLLVK